MARLNKDRPPTALQFIQHHMEFAKWRLRKDGETLEELQVQYEMEPDDDLLKEIQDLDDDLYYFERLVDDLSAQREHIKNKYYNT